MIVFGMMRKESFLSSLGSLCCFLSRERVKNILGGVSFFYNIYFAFTWKYLKCLCDIRFLEVSLWNVISDAFDRKGLTQDTRRLPGSYVQPTLSRGGKGVCFLDLYISLRWNLNIDIESKSRSFMRKKILICYFEEYQIFR